MSTAPDSLLRAREVDGTFEDIPVMLVVSYISGLVRR